VDPVLDTAPCGFLSFADDGSVLAVNRTLLELLRLQRESVVGKPFDRLLPLPSRIFYQTHLFPLLKLHGRADEIYLTLRASDGAELPVMLNALRRQSEGTLVNDCAVMSMRQRGEYEERILDARNVAEEATRAKDEFLAVVSHELRTPLAAVLGWVRLLRSGTLDDSQRAHAVEAIERSARVQTQLVEDILDFARIVAGKVRLDTTEVEPATIATAALDVVRPAAQAKGIVLEASLDGQAGPVLADADRLQQVLWNLLANAVKFTPKGGRVRIDVSRADSSVQVTVQDTGRGIDAAFLPFVFDRFRQAETSREQGGLGLGLAITRHLVELHGGSIGAESEGEGRGARFIVRLPVIVARSATGRAHDATCATATGSSSGETMLRDCHVLVVDDAEEARELLGTIITRHGGEVTAVSNARDALAALHRVRPDVIVSDIEMAGENGYVLMRRIRALSRESGGRTPAIALTAHAGEAERAQALGAGFQLHLAKPVDPDSLVIAITTLLESR
jgi:signal transduction histidine kinase/ActR/RegA family two-component response regulator